MLAALASDDYESYMADTSNAEAVHRAAKEAHGKATKAFTQLRRQPAEDDLDEEEFIAWGPDEGAFNIGSLMEDEYDAGPLTGLDGFVKKRGGKLQAIV